MDPDRSPIMWIWEMEKLACVLKCTQFLFLSSSSPTVSSFGMNPMAHELCTDLCKIYTNIKAVDLASFSR